VSESVPAERKYDLYSQATKNDPYTVFAQMQHDDPVFCQPGLDGKTMIWFLTRFDDVQAMLGNDAVFVRDPKNALNTDQLGTPHPLNVLLNNHMLNKDGDEHHRLRNLIGKAFTPARVRALRPRVQAIADELLDAVSHRGRMDLMADYAFALPTIVISESLGIPSTDRERFKDWSNAVISPALTEAAQANAVKQLESFVGYLRDLFQARRAEPRDDLITALVQAEESGDQLSEAELFSTTILLIVAGHETTVNLIGNAVLALLRHPEARAHLQANPQDMEAAIEEFLRFDGPVERVFSRWAAQDTSISGHRIARGDLVMGIVGAANRDPARFAAPETLNIAREPKRHLAFGHGMHYCLGAPLARLEGEIALSSLLRRLPDLRLGVPESELVWRTVPMFRGLSALPLEWEGI
jgi:cytochrome P450